MTGPLPVVFWIHGGGYVCSDRHAKISNLSTRYVGGAASSYDGSVLVQESNNAVVAVIIQYRLGVFGKLRVLHRDYLQRLNDGQDFYQVQR